MCQNSRDLSHCLNPILKKMPTIGIIIFIGFILVNSLILASQQDDNYGIIEAQVVDAQTGEPVQEIFYMSILRGELPGKPVFYLKVKSNATGFATTKIEPGYYGIVFFPYKSDSTYTDYIAPELVVDSMKMVKVEAGKKVKIVYKALLGGKLKIILVGSHGEKLVPKNMFNPEDMRSIPVNLKNISVPDHHVQINNRLGDSIDDGEVILYGLFPGIYEMEFIPKFMGYGPILIDGIVVERGKVTTTSVTINFSDQTGIHGYISGLSGQPISNARIRLRSENINEYYSASARTDSKGYFKIVGIKAGKYSLAVLYDVTEYRLISKYISDIIIKKGKIISKNAVIDY